MPNGKSPWVVGVKKDVEDSGGEVLVHYNQGLDSRALQGGGITKNGWCLAMSVFWIVRKAKNEDFWAWFKPPYAACPSLVDKTAAGGVGENVNALRKLMDSQKKLGVVAAQGLTTATREDWWLPAITEKTDFRVDVSSSQIFEPAAPPSVIGFRLTQGPGFKMLLVKGPGGAHAMCAYVFDDTVTFLDPNFGEFYFGGYRGMSGCKQFNAFFDTFYAHSKYKHQFANRAEIVSLTGPGLWTLAKLG